jgi:hypothetical protein
LFVGQPPHDYCLVGAVGKKVEQFFRRVAVSAAAFRFNRMEAMKNRFCVGSEAPLTLITRSAFRLPVRERRLFGANVYPLTLVS